MEEGSYILETEFTAVVEEVTCLTDNPPDAPMGLATVQKAVNEGPDNYTAVRLFVNGERWVTLKLKAAKELRDVLNELNLDDWIG